MDVYIVGVDTFNKMRIALANRCQYCTIGMPLDSSGIHTSVLESEEQVPCELTYEERDALAAFLVSPLIPDERMDDIYGDWRDRASGTGGNYGE